MFRQRVTAAVVTGVFLAGGAAQVLADVKVGDQAPTFTLSDPTGQSHSLGEYKGKFVVLEWFNNECPFVRKHYDSGNMQSLQEEATGKGAVWLTLSSSAPGKQGHMSDEQAIAVIKARGAHQTALLRDPAGTVGRLYGATTTPHLFVVSPAGRVIYAGAIDDKPSPDPGEVTGATNYVRQALNEAMAGKPVTVPSTKSYGCSVKY